MKNRFSNSIFGLFLSVFLLPLAVFSQTDTDVRSAAKIKTKIESAGIGSTVSVQLQNKEKLKGKILRINSDSFVMQEITAGTLQTVSYAQVKSLNKPGVSKGIKITAVVVGVLFVLSLIGNGFGG